MTLGRVMEWAASGRCCPSWYHVGELGHVSGPYKAGQFTSCPSCTVALGHTCTLTAGERRGHRDTREYLRLCKVRVGSLSLWEAQVTACEWGSEMELGEQLITCQVFLSRVLLECPEPSLTLLEGTWENTGLKSPAVVSSLSDPCLISFIPWHPCKILFSKMFFSETKFGDCCLMKSGNALSHVHPSCLCLRLPEPSSLSSLLKEPPTHTFTAPF